MSKRDFLVLSPAEKSAYHKVMCDPSPVYSITRRVIAWSVVTYGWYQDEMPTQGSLRIEAPHARKKKTMSYSSKLQEVG